MMKRFYSLLLFVLLAPLMAIAQEPCGWFPGPPTPDQATLDANLKHAKCFRVNSGNTSPVFDADGIARIDDVWYSADTVNIARHAANYGSNNFTPDPNFKAWSRFMYDQDYMYILILISGDLDVDATGGGDINLQDRVEFMFQNTYGGKGTAADHFGSATFANYYWMGDGDRKWVMPLDKASSKIQWLDQDLNDDGVGTDCGEVAGDDWLVLSATGMVQYNVYHSNDTIIYETAFSLKNWMKYTYTDVSELEYQKFGFDFSIRDVDADVMTDHINLNDLGNNAWAWAPALAEFTFDTALKVLDCVATPNDPRCVNININVKSYKQNYSLSIFPNPATTEISITSNINISKVEISNIVGQVVLTKNNVSSDAINVANLSQGVYIINAYSDKQLIGTQKLIKR